MNHTRLTVSTPDGVTASVVVDTDKLRTATWEAYDGLTRLLAGVIRKKTGQLADPSAWTWSAEPVGPQLRLVAVNGAVL